MTPTSPTYTARGDYSPPRCEYGSSNRVMAQRMYWLEHPPNRTPRRKPPHPTPPISKATRRRIEQTWPRRRHNGEFYRAEAAEKKRRREERRNPPNAIAQAAAHLAARYQLGGMAA
jgi:hypothetical protein